MGYAACACLLLALHLVLIDADEHWPPRVTLPCPCLECRHRGGRLTGDIRVDAADYECRRWEF